MNVSVMALTLSMLPLSQSAVSMQCASRSPVTPLPATFTSRRHSPGAALRQVLGDGPVLQELGAVMEDAPEPALVDQLLGQRDGGDAAVVVRDQVGHAGLLDGLDHLQALRPVPRQRLLAQDHLAGLGGGDGDFPRACCSGRVDVDEVNVLARDELAPVRFDRFVAPLGGEGLGLGLVEVADRLEDGLIFEVEEVADLAGGVGVRAAHEAATDESDVEFLHKELVMRDWYW